MVTDEFGKEQERWNGTHAENVEAREQLGALIARALARLETTLAGVATGVGISDARSVAALDATLYDAELVEAAADYVHAYDAWWSSLMRPPYNAEKSSAHLELATASHEAWRRYLRVLGALGENNEVNE